MPKLPGKTTYGLLRWKQYFNGQVLRIRKPDSTLCSVILSVDRVKQVESWLKLM